MKDYEAYRGIYCSLCKTLGKSYGLLSRFTLNYDFVFLALLRLSSAEDAEMHFKKCRCTFNPAVKCNRLCTYDNSLEYSADVAMLLLYGKVCDNIKDESFFKRLGYRLLLPFAKSKRKKAAKKHPVLSEKIDVLLSEQEKAEDSEKFSLDACCHPSAAALAEITSYGIENDAVKRIYERIGYCIGKWVYLADALDDLESDRDKKRFNPFLVKYSGLSEKQMQEDAVCQMNVCISEAIAAYELLSVKNFGNILENILYKGLPSVQRDIIRKKTEKTAQSSK